MHATICISIIDILPKFLTIPSSTRQSVVLQGANYWQYESRSLQWPDDSAAAFRSRPGARFRTSKHSWDLSTIDSDIHTYIHIYYVHNNVHIYISHSIWYILYVTCLYVPPHLEPRCTGDAGEWRLPQVKISSWAKKCAKMSRICSFVSKVGTSLLYLKYLYLWALKTQWCQWLINLN